MCYVNKTVVLYILMFLFKNPSRIYNNNNSCKICNNQLVATTN